MRANRSKRADIRRELLAITMAVAAAGTTTAATAALDIFVKLGEIKGESVDSKHKGEIDVLAWSWGLAGPSRNSPGVPQRPVGPAKDACAQSITLTKFIDVASPSIMGNAALGKNIASAQLAVRRSEQSEDFLVITLKDVVPHCKLQGGNPQPFTVVRGKSVLVNLVVICGEPPPTQ